MYIGQPTSQAYLSLCAGYEIRQEELEVEDGGEEPLLSTDARAHI
jgi:hypothetical protein